MISATIYLSRVGKDMVPYQPAKVKSYQRWFLQIIDMLSYMSCYGPKTK